MLPFPAIVNGAPESLHLDISQVVEKHGVYRCENHTLAMLVENLPSLVSLDISGTNLAGTVLGYGHILRSGQGCRSYSCLLLTVLGYGHTCDLAATTKTLRPERHTIRPEVTPICDQLTRWP
uniref:Zer-1-like leucine-rich repeats region domain-containing protein n=1 Tax=Timema poppense TaxID=170557 RepID=A0A7R9DPG1_TIMPO|nr:unnamed protein product [Timema poppensis]